MALTRTSTEILLESDDGNFYWVSLVDVGDEGSPAYTPVADAADPQADDGSDGYVPLVADNGTVYRWSLLAPEDDNVQHKFTVSPDQNETTDTSISIDLDGVTYAVSLIVTDSIVSHMVEAVQAEVLASSTEGSRRKRARYGPGWDWWWEVPQPYGVRSSPTYNYDG